MTHRYPTKPILIVDDEPDWISTLKMALQFEGGYDHFVECSDSTKVVDVLSATPCSLVLLDLNMPRLTGMDLLPEIVANFPEVKVLIVSGVSQVQTAFECVKKGAYSYIIKSSELSQIVINVKNALWAQQLEGNNHALQQVLIDDSISESFDSIPTRNEKMRAAFRYCEAIANSTEPILIFGESGVGKELLAQAIHKAHCPTRPFVPLNIAGLDDAMFTDTLFGHSKGAFTGATERRRGLVEEAGDGILFLDEIGSLQLESQTKLLRLLQEKEYLPVGSDRPKKTNAKFLFATNDDLQTLVKKGLFRKDLFYRLSSHQVHLPPLRERREDIPLLIDLFVQQAREVFDKKELSVYADVYRLLNSYPFPGNVRELRAMTYDAVAQAQDGVVDSKAFLAKMKHRDFVPENNNPSSVRSGVIFPSTLPSLQEMNDSLVEEALTRTNGNHREAAELLGITRSALTKRLSKKKKLTPG